LQAGLFLDSRAGIRRGGESGPAVVPGNAGKSLLIRALRHDGFEMPPSGRLPAATIAAFETWIDLGAPDPRDGAPTVSEAPTIDFEAGRSFWSFQPLRNTVTAGAMSHPVKDASWARTPVDRFILSRQETAGISPGKQADRRTFIRRAYFDLLGLPPTRSQEEAFRNDLLPGAHERLIDELLASPHHGERWARHWLDLARFAESNGYAFDRDRPGAYHFRDFVLQAFNDDLPYDEFVRLQIAGDLLEADDYMSLAATGFLMAGPYTTQQTQKERERSRYEQLDDMVSTFGTALLGLTLGCARCHDHKYDPVSAHDYYRLTATLAEVGFEEIGLDLTPEVYERAKAEFDTAHQPYLEARARYEDADLRAHLEKWVTARPADVAAPKLGDWHSIGAFKSDTFDQGFAAVFEPEEVFRTENTVDLGAKFGKRSWKPRPKWTDGKVQTGILGRRQTLYLYRTIEIESTTPWEVTIGHNDGIKVWINGHFVFLNKKRREKPENYDKVVLPLQAGKNELLIKVVNDRGESNFYFQAAEKSPPERIAPMLAKAPPEWTPEETQELLTWFRGIDPEWSRLDRAVWDHEKLAPKREITKVFSAKDGGTTYEFGDNTRKVYHLVRGNSDNKKTLAKPGFLQVLMPPDETGTRWTQNISAEDTVESAPRIALARWVTDTQHGAGNLLARVIVNRLWQHLFGRGIVSTPSDFGLQGERPTHPELLDYLAAELVRNDWHLKPVLRLILNSSVYRQGGATENSANKERDPDNRLFWRHPSRRLEAEIIRDALLAASGRLERRISGKGTLQAESPRRSIYLTVKRSELVPLLQLFDAPDAMQSIGERSTTTISPQALALMNSDFVRDIAEALAKQSMAASPGKLEGVVEAAYWSALSRPPTTVELADMVALIETHTDSYGDHERAVELATTDFCQLLLCLNEFVYID